MSLPSKRPLETLRVRAEKALKNGYFRNDSSFSHIKDYLHELQVYQVELEMQAEELQRSQTELEISRDEYSLLYNDAPVGYISISFSGIILKANQTFAGMVHCDLDDLYRKPLSRFLCDDHHSLFYTICNRAVDSEQFHTCELDFLRADTSTFSARLDLTPHESSPGMEAHYKITVVDITEKKKAEQEKLRLQTEILKYQKDASLKRLAGGIAHNFNNLLSVIMLNIELVQRAMLIKDQTVDSLITAYDASAKAAELSTMMLTYLGHPPWHTTTVDLPETIKGLMAIIQSTLHGSIQLSLIQHLGPLRINGDPSQISQILNNIIENSIEAIGDENGSITIKLYEESITNKFSSPVSYGEKVKPGRYACIEVIDDGCGMDHNTLQMAIDPFFTTNFTGRGLGLSAVWGIVRAHDGYLFIDSQLETGTITRVFLPLAELPESHSEHISTQAEQQQNDNQPLLENETILYVDDDPIIREIGRRLLEDLGVEAIEAGGGIEAVELYKRHQEDVSCVVLDYAMPDQDGNITLIELRKLNPDLPVLLVSGFLKEQAIKRFTIEKPDGFLQKPFCRAEFTKALTAILSNAKRLTGEPKTTI